MFASEGSPESRARVIELLADTLVFTPATAINRDNSNSDVRKISVVTMQVDGHRFVPTFTTEDAFFAWSKDQYQCLSVMGSDLALSLPRETGLIVNLSGANECTLKPDEVWQMSVGPDAEGEESAKEISGSLNELEDELAAVFRVSFPVKEAYLVSVDRQPPGAVLGLQLNNATAEERFDLMTKIAELSRKYFDEASAIEVFDDLHQSNSASWELFMRSKPFFEREFGSEQGSEGSLADEIQQISYYSANPNRLRHESQQKPTSLLDRLSRFFQR